MRLNNSSKSALFDFLGTLVSLIIGVVLVFVFAERMYLHFLGWKSWLLLLIPISLLLIFYFRGRPYFAYDSDGEALNFKNRHLYSFLGKSANDEFPKYKVKNFEILNALIFRKLYVTISSKKSSSITLKYDISYLSSQEVRDLKLSLNKVVKSNNEKAGN